MRTELRPEVGDRRESVNVPSPPETSRGSSIYNQLYRMMIWEGAADVERYP